MVTVEVLRALFFDPTKSINNIQTGTGKRRPVKGKLWLASTTVPKPVEHTITNVIIQATEALGDGAERYTRSRIEGRVTRV
jgi:hypothetical protein